MARGHRVTERDRVIVTRLSGIARRLMDTSACHLHVSSVAFPLGLVVLRVGSAGEVTGLGAARGRDRNGAIRCGRGALGADLPGPRGGRFCLTPPCGRIAARLTEHPHGISTQPPSFLRTGVLGYESWAGEVTGIAPRGWRARQHVSQARRAFPRPARGPVQDAAPGSTATPVPLRAPSARRDRGLGLAAFARAGPSYSVAACARVGWTWATAAQVRQLPGLPLAEQRYQGKE
jgi:hypothetical protein